MNGVPSSCKRDPREALCPLSPSENAARRPPFMNQGERSRQTLYLPSPCSCTSSPQNFGKYTLLISKPPSLWHFVTVA